MANDPGTGDRPFLEKGMKWHLGAAETLFMTRFKYIRGSQEKLIRKGAIFQNSSAWFFLPPLLIGLLKSEAGNFFVY